MTDSSIRHVSWIPLVLVDAVGRALMSTPAWPPLSAELRMTPATLALAIERRPELFRITKIRGVPFSIVESPPHTADDWTLLVRFAIAAGRWGMYGDRHVLLDT